MWLRCYGLFLAHEMNVLFTLFVCLCLLYAYDHMQRRGLFWLTFTLVTALTAFAIGASWHPAWCSRCMW